MNSPLDGRGLGPARLHLGDALLPALQRLLDLVAVLGDRVAAALRVDRVDQIGRILVRLDLVGQALDDGEHFLERRLARDEGGERLP